MMDCLHALLLAKALQAVHEYSSFYWQQKSGKTIATVEVEVESFEEICYSIFACEIRILKVKMRLRLRKTSENPKVNKDKFCLDCSVYFTN